MGKIAAPAVALLEEGRFKLRAPGDELVIAAAIRKQDKAVNDGIIQEIAEYNKGTQRSVLTELLQ